MEEPTHKSSSQHRKATIRELSRFLRALENTPEEIASLPLQEVFEEIARLGADYNAVRANVQHHIKINRARSVRLSL